MDTNETPPQTTKELSINNRSTALQQTSFYNTKLQEDIAISLTPLARGRSITDTNLPHLIHSHTAPDKPPHHQTELNSPVVHRLLNDKPSNTQTQGSSSIRKSQRIFEFHYIQFSQQPTHRRNIYLQSSPSVCDLHRPIIGLPKTGTHRNIFQNRTTIYSANRRNTPQHIVFCSENRLRNPSKHNI